MSKRYLRDPNLKVVADLVTDDDVELAFLHTNFGHTDFRGLLAQGCIKSLAGWHQGHTLTTILHDLSLINWNRDKDTIKVTDKGRHYIWLAFKNRPGV